MARAWFLRVLLNSSSFSAILRSISCLTWPSSSWALSTLFSSASRDPSASSRAPCSSSFSVSILLLCLSSSWMERPPSPSWSSRSLISSARFLFSRRTMSSCSLDSSRADLRRNLSLLKLRASEWAASSSAIRSSAFAFHSPTTLSKFLPRFSVMQAAAWVLSYSMASSSSSEFMRAADFSADPILAFRASMFSSASATLAASLCLDPSSSSMRPRASVSYLDFHSWISDWALLRALRTSIFFLRFSDSEQRALNLVSRAARSRASPSASFLVSSNWVPREILFFCRAPIAFSVSSIWRERSWDSTSSFFLVESASLRARASSSCFWLDSTIRPWAILQFFSMLARSRIASSSPALASWRSLSMPALSFSLLALFLLIPSIWLPNSAILLLCFWRRAARVPSWAMLASSKSAFNLTSSPSRFLFSSIWVLVLEPTSASLVPRSSRSLDSRERFFSALARLLRSTESSSSSSSTRAWSSLTCFVYFEPRVCSSSILAATEETSLSLRWTVWPSSELMRSRSATASWVSLRSPSTFLFCFSTSPLAFFSRSSVSSHSSRDCSSFPFTLFRWLHLSSADWMSSSVFCLPSPVAFFSLPSLTIMSSWWAISSLRVRIWESLVFLSSSHFSMVASRFLISSLSLQASAVTLAPACWIWLIWSSSPLMRALVASTCFCRSFLAPSNLLVLSMISSTAEHWRTASSMLASAMAIFSSYSFLYLPNWVHFKVGLIASQSQVLAIMYARMARWQAYRAIFWSCSFLNCILEALPLAPACSQARTDPILFSRCSSIQPPMPALKNTRVCPRRNFSLSSLTMSMTAWAAALSFLAFATAAAPMMLKRALNSGYVILLGKPARQMAIPARTPLHWYWCMIRPGSTPPGCLWVLGTTQRMKWG